MSTQKTGPTSLPWFKFQALKHKRFLDVGVEGPSFSLGHAYLENLGGCHDSMLLWNIFPMQMEFVGGFIPAVTLPFNNFTVHLKYIISRNTHVST